MDFHYKQILKVGAVSGLIYLFYSQVRELIQSIQDSAFIQAKQVANLSEVVHLLKSKQPTRLNLIKLKPYYFQKLDKQISIKSMQKLKFQPSDKDIVKFFSKKLSKSITPKTKIEDIKFKWYASIQGNQNLKYQKIHGFGDIKGDFFDIQRQFEPKRHLNYWTRFRHWISKQFVRIGPRPNNVGTINSVKPLFLGPVIGYLNYEINLMKDINIMAACNIENGQIIPTVTALSKSDLLNYFQSKIDMNYLKVGGIVFLTTVMCRWLWSDIKVVLNMLKVKKQKLTSSYFNPEGIDEDKTCIICYTNCRNMVVFDCRHMIMCRECSENYQSDTCPYCKKQIDQIKMVHGAH